MDNLTDGLHIAVSILIFIIAVSLTMYLFSRLTSTAEIVYEIALQPGYYSEIEIDRDENTELGSKRIVGKNDIKIEDNRSQSKSNNTKVAHNINTKAAQTNTQIKKEIKSNVNEDEWESF